HSDCPSHASFFPNLSPIGMYGKKVSYTLQQMGLVQHPVLLTPLERAGPLEQPFRTQMLNIRGQLEGEP
ncbi:hypothetical protein D6779_03825, partial [Candidatus Parcubacteria bacterium]